MEETVLAPSPNWFQVSGLAVSTDGWLIYGGPTKSLCVLEPLLSDNGVIEGDQRYKAHVVSRAHKEKMVSVDIHPGWPSRRNFITASADGAVKEWNVEESDKQYSITYIHGHEAHVNEKEEVVGVGYSTDTVAVTVGSFGNIIKWDLNSNVVKAYNLVKNFKPTAVSCSRHIPLHVAIGTKQGVVILVDLTGPGKIVYKVRGQDDEVVQLMFCPQYEVTVRKQLTESTKRWSPMERIERIRNEPEPTESKPELVGNELAQAASSNLEMPKPDPDDSGVNKTLPDDSFDNSIVLEDDMFDIYKDHEADEFGHKKFVPKEMYVKVKTEKKQEDFLAECMKLKEAILKRKNEPEESIESLVEAMDRAKVDDTKSCTSNTEGNIEARTSADSVDKAKENQVKEDAASVHIHKHLLASVSKHGGVRIWSKSGNLVATCVVQTGFKNAKLKAPNWPTLYWYKRDSLLIADGRSQLLECNPLKIDCKNKLEWRIIHSIHRRGLYCIMSDAPRIQTPELISDPSHDDTWTIFTAAQDRNIVRYSLKLKKQLAVHATCGGFVYDVKPCPYDASKIAIAVGDGAVRVIEGDMNDAETRLLPVTVATYWQNVQGKVLTVAWHPTKENLLAFSTAESRVGLIDTSSKTEKPAKVLLSALNNGVYSMCWAEDMELYACGGGKLVLYHANNINEAPIPVPITVEAQQWDISAAVYNCYGLLVGSNAGGVALLSGRGGDVIAATFVFSKMIHTMQWHPQQTSSSNELSKYKDHLAVCSLDKQNAVVILQYTDKEGGGKELSTRLKLNGHKGAVLQLAWNPHCDGLLLSTSQDATVRVWSLAAEACLAIFGCDGASLGAAWSPRPSLPRHLLAGGGDCALRLWDWTHYPAEHYQEKSKEPAKKKKKEKSKEKKEIKDNMATEEQTDDQSDDGLDNIASNVKRSRIKGSKKFLFPEMAKRMIPANSSNVRNVIHNYLKTHSQINNLTDVLSEVPQDCNTEYLKLFSNMNDLHKMVEIEKARHLEMSNVESYIMLLIVCGDIATMVEFAKERDLLDPFLLAIAPCVSYKYWKEVTQMYVAQIDRIMAKGEDDKLLVSRSYGGSVYRMAATLLSIHDAKAAVDVLVEARLYKEAYVLCRVRHMESIALETLAKWAAYCADSGQLVLGAVCYLALGNVSKAATVLGKSNEQEDLNLAAELAKAAGHNTFADHMEKKAKDKVDQTTEQILEGLPSRIELLLKEQTVDKENLSDNINGDSGVVDEDKVHNGGCVES